jgi:tetratricopeptide (TPR) repeat protein
MKNALETGLVLVVLMLLGGTLRAQSVEQGVQLFNAGKYADAKAVLLPHGEREPNAAFHLGRIEMENDEAGSAAGWFERAVRMNPKSAVYHDWLGRAYGTQARRANMFRAASLAGKTKTAFETAVALDPENLDAREGLMAFYAGAPGMVGGSKEKAREVLLEIRKRNAYRGSLAAAGLCAREKNTACAESELNAMLKRYPDSAAVYSSLAALHADQKRFDKAFAVIDDRLGKKPNEAISLYQLGRTASLSGERLDDGERALKTSLAGPIPERGPEPAHVHYRLGMIYEKKGAKDLAREEYRTTLKLRPRHRDAEKALAALR